VTEARDAGGLERDREEPDSAFLSSVLSSSRDAIAFLLPTGVVSEWSPAAARVFGWTSAEMTGRHFRALVPPESASDTEGLLRESEQRGPSRRLMTGVRKDGSRFHADASVLPVRSSDGGLVAFVVVVRNVTESILTVAATSITYSDETISSGLDPVANAMRVLVPFDRLTLWSVDGDACRRVASNGFGLPPRSAEDVHPLADTAHEETIRTGARVTVDDTSAPSFADDDALRADGVGSYVILPLFHDGVVAGTLDVEFARSGRTTPAVLVALDRVASVVAPALANMLAFDRQAATLRRLQHLDAAKNDFLALMTHDMRTPLAVIAGFAETLRDRWDDLPEREKLESIDAILRNGLSLFRLVDEGLDVALIESGSFVYEMASLDLGAQLAKTVADVSSDAKRPIHLAIDQDVPFVHADRDRHRQVITNLLSNAIKFSPPGSPIEVRATRVVGRVQVACRDHGIGIHPDDVPLLFRKGSRLGSGDSAAARGAGLGLFICKAIVEAHGGRIWFEPTPGGGSTFSYTLPAASAFVVPAS
jgi:PAS domain S-box-containing protein